MKKKTRAVISIIIVIILTFLYAHIDKNSYLYDRQADTSTFVNTGILENEEIQQTFVCQENTIDGMNVKCTTAGSYENTLIEYSLMDEESGKVLGEGCVEGSVIINNKFHLFKFNEISGVKGKTLVFKIRETKSDDFNGLSFYITQEQKSGTSLRVKGNDTQGTLIARSVSHQFDPETFFVLILFIVYVVVFMKILYKLFK